MPVDYHNLHHHMQDLRHIYIWDHDQSLHIYKLGNNNGSLNTVVQHDLKLVTEGKSMMPVAGWQLILAAYLVYWLSLENCMLQKSSFYVKMLDLSTLWLLRSVYIKFLALGKGADPNRLGQIRIKNQRGLAATMIRVSPLLLALEDHPEEELPFDSAVASALVEAGLWPFQWPSINPAVHVPNPLSDPSSDKHSASQPFFLSFLLSLSASVSVSLSFSPFCEFLPPCSVPSCVSFVFSSFLPSLHPYFISWCHLFRPFSLLPSVLR